MTRLPGVLFAAALLTIAVVNAQNDVEVSGVRFNPRVQVSCDEQTMSVTIHTDDGYSGIAHVDDMRADEACRVIGSGSRTTVLRFNLRDCGSSYVAQRRAYVNKITVRLHFLVVLVQDKHFDIRCSPGVNNNTVTAVSGMALDVFERVENWEPRPPLTSAYIDQTYLAQITVDDDLKRFNYWVKSCEATSDGSNTRIPLIAEPGCTVNPSLMSDFQAVRRGSSMEYQAALRAFTINDAPRVHLTCIVLICRGMCPGVNCSEPMHPTILPGDDTQEVLTATSLYILNPGEGSPDALRVCDEPERCGYFDLLLGLVIALGILLLFCVILLLCLWPCAYSRCCRAGAADDERKEEIPEYFATKDSTDWGSTIPFRFVPQYNSDSNRDSYDTRSDVTKESNNTMGTKSWHRAFSVHSTPIFTNYPVVLPDGQQAPPGAPHSVTGYSQNGRSRPQSRYSSYAA